jgi:hypothetical protein
MASRAGSTLIFDDQGQIWNADSLELRRRLYCTWADADLTSQLVRNLGFVSVAVGRSSVRINLRPRTVSEVAIAQLLYWLADHPRERIVLSHELNGGSHEILISLSRLARRIAELVVEARPNTAFFQSRRLCKRDLGADSLLATLIELWRANGCTFAWDQYRDFIDARLGGRFFVLRPWGKHQDFIIEGAGNGLRIPGSNWFARYVGAPFSLTPDYDYSVRVSQSYNEALRVGDPHIEDVDALIAWPQHGRVRRQYRRIILPCAGTDGHVHLLGATCTDTVDLGVKVIEEAS